VLFIENVPLKLAGLL